MSSSKKARTKPPRGRPQSTSALSQPLAQDVVSSSTLSTFSPSGAFFAFLSLAIDKHRIRIYDTTTCQSIAEHTLDSSRVTALEWAHFDTSSKIHAEADDDGPRKKRKKRPSLTTSAATPDLAPEVVLLGLSDGTLLVYSPSHARVLRTLSHPSSTSPIIALDTSSAISPTLTVWSSGTDSSLRLWNVHQGTQLSSTKIDDRIPCTAIRAYPAQEDDDAPTRILMAHHRIRLLSTAPSSSLSDSTKPKEIAAFTGHASNVTAIRWQSKNARHFASIAEGDRHIQLWAVPEPGAGEGALVASLPLDTDARCISFASQSGRAPLLALSASGRVAIFDVAAATAPKEKAKTTAVGSRTNIRPPKQGSPIVAAAFTGEGSVRVARLIGGVKPVFDVVRYMDDIGEYLPEIALSPVDPAAMADSSAATSAAPNRRFSESDGLTVGSGLELGQDATMDDLPEVGGDLDVDLAELSLGQRLTALDPGARAHPLSPSDDEDSEREEADDVAGTQTSVTLTRTLIQALHSSDARLLEACLSHTRAELVLNTVRRLPPQLALPLLSACVERLGRGKRGSTGKGRGGGAGSQRAAGMVRWVKTVLVVHSGHLMTMPDLVARLSGLHATLTARMALQESLLSLSGRLDMVLQQIELRGATAPAPIAPSVPGKGKGKGKGKARALEEKVVRRYVEGESEEEGMDVDVDVEEGASEGSVEDVELGGESDVDEDSDEEDSEEGDESEEDEEDEYEDSEDEDNEGDEDGPRLNGFIDDEAEESEDEGSESE
ncbi:WD40-repeat-containing domain protein [Amylostereum chailletii]|nr:WD40-repeat-containing domain protein [Amylostereum chailletii]